MYWNLSSGYRPLFQIREIESAIKIVKDAFETLLREKVGLQRVTAPVAVPSGCGLNDDLNGVEKPVRFHVSGVDVDVEIVQSLAKWKRTALARYGFQSGEGLYTDMNAIRPDEIIDHLHSIYVDQWDWEKAILPEDRTLETLQTTVRQIWSAITATEEIVTLSFPQVKRILPKAITFITSEALLQRYPGMTPKERETAACREYGAIFLIGIGGTLSDGTIHDGRAPDYDDWTTLRVDGGFGLNGDILVWHPVLETAFELSSMGIRVDGPTLLKQLEIRGCPERAKLPFHRALIEERLPLSMGGGIGQSRLCMLMMRCGHIGEIACGVWPDEMIQEYAAHGITLL
ncbi:MAG: aspartate--ammonia ligase [Thermoguttaceae bacterium]|nr:aspartate--ammonia ligase [Thermoguttaceae bacterium]